MTQALKDSENDPRMVETRGNRGMDSIRAAIVDAARRLASRDGAEAVTLDGTAAEAGFAPTTIYAHFVSKDDLQTAVAADDLQNMASVMRQSQAAQQQEAAEQPGTDEAPAGASEATCASQPAEDPGEAQSDETGEPETDSESGETHSAERSADGDETLRRSPRGYLRRLIGDAATPSDAAKPDLRRPAANSGDVAAAITRLEDRIIRVESRPVNSWLERRLRVFERTLSDLNARAEKLERETANALSTLADGHKAVEQRVGETLDNATKQTAESEQRHRAVAADLRMYVKDLSGRLSAIENSVSRLLSEKDETVDAPAAVGPEASQYVEAAEQPPVARSEIPEQSDLVEAETENGDEQAAPQDYLAAARRAANLSVGASVPEPDGGPMQFFTVTPKRAHGLSLSRRALQIIAGVLIVIVGAIAATIALGNKAAAVAPPRHVVRVAAVHDGDTQVAALAKAGDAKAALVLGLQELIGDGRAVDLPAAASWLTRAASHGQPLAQYWVGTLYERGRGLARDRGTAMSWYEKAAGAGNAKAMYRLGVGYAEGWTGTPDYGRAAEWFTHAAGVGLIDAQFNLAVLYERGEGVPQSFVNALKWYDIAAAQGDANSEARAKSLATQITSSDAAAAQAEAAKFEPQSPDPVANNVPAVAGMAQASLTLQ